MRWRARSTYSSDVSNWRMVFDGHKQEDDSVHEVDPAQGRHSHVQEHAEQHGQWNVAQHRAHEH